MQPLTIALIAVVFVHDQLVADGMVSDAADGRLASYALSLMVGLVAAASIRLRQATRRLSRRGDGRAIVVADRIMMVGPMLFVVAHCFNVLSLHWLSTVRDIVGDLVLVDELIATAPPVLGMVVLWWTYYPIERRVREATLMRYLDESRPVPPLLSRPQYVTVQVRHQLLLTLLPLLLIMAWVEALGRTLPSNTSPIAAGVLQLAGVATIFLFAPLIIRLAWDTVPLPPSELRNRLEALCRRHRARVRQLLIWRTHHGMINGAVMGLIGRLRYILLTDGLIDSMPAAHIEAVMAHELGHIKRWHLPTMIGLLMVCVGAIALVISFGATYATYIGQMWFMPGVVRNTSDAVVLEAIIQFSPIILGLFVFGYFSRRIERQADTFAVQHLTVSLHEASGAESDPPRVVTQEAVDAMAGALGRVAVLNHIPVDRRSWRHGSIKWRQDYLQSIVGQPLDRLSIDRTVVVYRIIAVVGAAALLVFLAWPFVFR